MAAIYDASPGWMSINTFFGNADNIAVTFPMDISSGYTFSLSVLAPNGDVLFTAPATVASTYVANFPISTANNALIPPSGATFVMQWVNSTIKKTFIAGPILNPTQGVSA